MDSKRIPKPNRLFDDFILSKPKKNRPNTDNTEDNISTVNIIDHEISETMDYTNLNPTTQTSTMLQNVNSTAAITCNTSEDDGEKKKNTSASEQKLLRNHSLLNADEAITTSRDSHPDTSVTAIADRDVTYHSDEGNSDVIPTPPLIDTPSCEEDNANAITITVPIHSPNSPEATASGSQDANAPAWIDLLLTSLNSLNNKMENNNKTLTNQMEYSLTKLNQMEQNNVTLSHKIEINIQQLSEQLNNHNQTLTNMKDELNTNIKTFATVLDDKIENLATIVNTNSSEIQSIKSAQEQFDLKNYQFKNEIKSQLFKCITDIQRDTKEDINIQCQEIETKLTHQMNHVDSKLTNTITDHQQLCNDQFNRIKFDLTDEVKELLKENEHKILPITLKQQEQLNRLAETLNQTQVTIDQKLKEAQTTVTPNIFLTCNGNNNILNEQLIPKFYGKTTHPDAFLNKLRKYYEKGLANHPNLDPIEHLIDTIELSMEQHAAQWFYLIKDDIESWDDFETAFRRKYWSKEAQRAIKTKLEQEKYRDGGKLSRAEYFIERVILLKSIVPPLSEDEIISCLSDHYSDTIQNAIRVQNITTIKEFESLLQREDLRHINNRPRLLMSRSHQPPGNPNHRGQPQPFFNRPGPRYPNDHDRRYPINHSAYPPRYNNNNHNQNNRTSYNQSNIAQPQSAYHRNHGQEPRRPSSPHNRPERSYAPNPRDIENRRYPTREQNLVCSAVLERNINPYPETPPSSNNSVRHMSN